jgi:hypothetical protein
VGRLSDHPGLNITYIREIASLTDASVGGIAELPDAAQTGGPPTWPFAALGAAAAAVAIGAGAWYARRRWLAANHSPSAE